MSNEEDRRIVEAQLAGSKLAEALVASVPRDVMLWCCSYLRRIDDMWWVAPKSEVTEVLIVPKRVQ